MGDCSNVWITPFQLNSWVFNVNLSNGNCFTKSFLTLMTIYFGLNGNPGSLVFKHINVMCIIFPFGFKCHFSYSTWLMSEKREDEKGPGFQ